MNIELTILQNQIEDQREFWDASVVCRNPLAFGLRGRRQFVGSCPSSQVSLKGLFVEREHRSDGGLRSSPHSVNTTALLDTYRRSVSERAVASAGAQE